MSATTRGFTLVTYVAMLDVPRHVVELLARLLAISQATGYRYLHEGIDVLADPAPDLHEVLSRCQREGTTHVILDGTLIESNRLAGVRDNGNDLWFSQKHRPFGGNIQFSLAQASAYPSPSAAQRASPNRHFTSTPVCSTPCYGMCGLSASAPLPSSNSDGAPCSTSRSAPAGSATSPEQPLSSMAGDTAAPRPVGEGPVGGVTRGSRP
jgi:hypothetical protein